MVSVSLSKLVYCTQIESDPSFLASLYRGVSDTLRVVGTGALEREVTDALVEGCKVQLQNMAEKRKRRHPNPPSPSTCAASPAADAHEDEDEGLALLEEMEDFALEDMEKTLRLLDAQHPLLIAIASVRELGRASGDAWDETVGRVEE